MVWARPTDAGSPPVSALHSFLTAGVPDWAAPNRSAALKGPGSRRTHPSSPSRVRRAWARRQALRRSVNPAPPPFPGRTKPRCRAGKHRGALQACADISFHDFEGGAHGHRLAVGPIRRQRIEDVGGSNDAGIEVDLDHPPGPDRATRIEALMMGIARNARHVGEHRNPRQDLTAQFGVGDSMISADPVSVGLPFSSRMPSRHTELADIVKQGGALEPAAPRRAIAAALRQSGRRRATACSLWPPARMVSGVENLGEAGCRCRRR